MVTQLTGEIAQLVKIMSFNIMNRWGTGDIAWANRKNLVVSAIESFEPDLLGMQEGYCNQIEDVISGLTTSYASIGISRYGDMTDEYNNILYRLDKLHPEEWGQFWFSDTPDKPGSFSIHETKYPRICTWAKFRWLANNTEFYYFNTHLGLTEEARAQAVAILLDRIRKQVDSTSVPVILGGDFNMEETSIHFEQIEKEGFRDTWLAMGHDYTNDGTYHNFEGSRSLEHIDWIFQRNCIAVHAAQINEYHENGRYPSDHFPVQAIVEIPLGVTACK